MAFINSGGTGIFTASNNRVTIALTNPAGNVTVQQSDGAGGFFPMVCDGQLMTLDSNNTARSIYAPVDLKFTATGTSLIVKG